MIVVDALEIIYPNGTRALAPTSLSFQAGAFTVLLGASGAGKSSLLRCLNGLVRATTGSISVDGLGEIRNRTQMRAHRRNTGMVFQQHQLIGRLTVLANVLIGRLGYHAGPRALLRFSATEKALALAAIERVGLIEYALRRADELSGGQQQRVGIARALVQSPSLILADEPVASLDPASADRVLGLLHSICKADRMTAIVSLHQLEFARRYADRIIGLAGGEVVFDGPPPRLGSAEVARLYGTDTTSAHTPFGTIRHVKTGTYA